MSIVTKDSYKADVFNFDVEHGNANGYEYVWTETDVENLVNYLNDTLEKNND